jgi:YD repeat-containing protein
MRLQLGHESCRGYRPRGFTDFYVELVPECSDQGGGRNGHDYDYANRLIAAGVNGATSTYGYDAFGNRVWQAFAGATTTYPFRYYSLTSTVSGATTTATSTEFIFSGNTLLSTITRALLNGVATGTPTTLYIHPDNLGSINVVSDQNMNPVEVLSYYPYGGQRIASSTAGADSARKFIGLFSDPTNLVYANARYYNPGQVAIYH